MTDQERLDDLQRTGERCTWQGISNATLAVVATCQLLAGWSPWMIVYLMVFFSVVGFAQAFRCARKMRLIERKQSHDTP